MLTYFRTDVDNENIIFCNDADTCRVEEHHEKNKNHLKNEVV
jgi:hypothetical protein